jgi:hypothetical protein
MRMKMDEEEYRTIGEREEDILNNIIGQANNLIVSELEKNMDLVIKFGGIDNLYFNLVNQMLAVFTLNVVPKEHIMEIPDKMRNLLYASLAHNMKKYDMMQELRKVELPKE